LPATKALPDGHGELLLIVDDKSAIREIIKTALEAHGYDVILAKEGTEALMLYAGQRDKIGLVITDIAMPILDGYATIRALRKMNPDVKVIAVTGLTKPRKLEQLSSEGIVLVSKPYSIDKLLNSIYDTLHPAMN
jgi:two-component system, cell cycle sensor histidine kinase and response regulator CckA